MLIINSAAVQEAMLRREIGVMELANLARIPPKTISRAHRRNIPVQLPTLARLAKALGIEPEKLLKRDDSRDQ